MGQHCCVERNGKPGRSGECVYDMVAGALRTGARVVPRSVGTMRFVCDTQVPSFLLSRDVRVKEEVMQGPEGPLTLEWVVPAASSPRAGSPSSPASPPVPTSAGSPAAAGFPRIMLYLHGGAYVLCTPGSLRGVTSPLARTVGAALCVPAFRRPPEHKLTAALEDSMATYRHLVREYPTAEMFLGGESAGGGMVATMLSALRGSDLPMPRAAFLLSPWTDLGGDGEAAGLRHASLQNAGTDYLPVDLVTLFAERARGDLHGDRVPASPVFAEGSLADLPPIFVLYGQDEVLCGQIEHFCDVWVEKGAKLQRHAVRGGLHAPVLFNFCHGESHKALQELESFFAGVSMV